VTYTGSPRIDLEYISPNIFQTSYPTSPTGTPLSSPLRASNLKVGPSNDTALDFLYFQRTAAFQVSELALHHPSRRLFCSARFAKPTPLTRGRRLTSASLWKSRRDEIFGEIATLDFNERQGMTMRVVGVTP
jgi:hypothetical protein